MIKDLILRNRSYRRFDQSVAIDRQTLMELVDLARCSASAGNRQPLKYILSATPEKNARIFPQLAWAGLLKDWKGPAEGEKPAAYIIILGDKEISGSFGVDHGIAAQSILLGAVERGLGGCMIGNVRKDELRKSLEIPERYEILLAIALGKPGEKVVLETVGTNGDTSYSRDSSDVHHVPKRRLEEIVL
ncbi:MAG: nitroreductase family protein [Chloroflexota bacterium]